MKFVANYSLVSSKSNKYLQLVKKLQSQSKFRMKNNQFVIEGLRICEDALQNEIVFDYAFVSESFFDQKEEAATRFFENSSLSFIVRDQLFATISDTKTPQGILIVAKIPQTLRKISKGGKYIALDNLSDNTNLGAIARTAEAMGINGIIMTTDSCDPYSPKSLRASMGTLLRMPIYITDDLVSFFSQNGLNAVSFVVDDGASKLPEITFFENDVIVIGNEANGITENVKENSRLLVTIPMKGKTESLNAAAAAAIAIYEFAK